MPVGEVIYGPPAWIATLTFIMDDGSEKRPVGEVKDHLESRLIYSYLQSTPGEAQIGESKHLTISRSGNIYKFAIGYTEKMIDQYSDMLNKMRTSNSTDGEASALCDLIELEKDVLGTLKNSRKAKAVLKCDYAWLRVG
jgi:hypothetical protein